MPRTPRRTHSCARGGDRALRGAKLAAHLAVHDRHQRLPEGIERRPRLVLPVDYGPPTDPHEAPAPPLVESVWIEPYPDERLGLATPGRPEARYEQRESVELAFIAALQHLPAASARCSSCAMCSGSRREEAAEALERMPALVNSALQRAHKSVASGCPSEASRPRCGPSATMRRGTSSTPSSLHGNAATSTRWWRCWPTTSRAPCRRWRPGTAAATRWSASCAATPLAARAALASWSERAPAASSAFGFYRFEQRAAEVPRAQRHRAPRSTAHRSPTWTAFLTPELFEHFELPAELAETG